MESDGLIWIFFDGGCGLCNREIAHYANLDRSHGRIRWIDIMQNPQPLTDRGVTVDDAMRRFHVLDRRGELRTGAEAFLTLWSALPYYRFLAKLVCLTRMGPILEAGYRPFAAWRYARRKSDRACSLAAGPKA